MRPERQPPKPCCGCSVQSQGSRPGRRVPHLPAQRQQGSWPERANLCGVSTQWELLIISFGDASSLDTRCCSRPAFCSEAIMAAGNDPTLDTLGLAHLGSPKLLLRKKGGGMLDEFREFALRGSMLDMAVGIIIGAAFGRVVSSFVSDILMPPLGLLSR